MSKKEKLLKRLKTIPIDFSYEELKTLLLALGFEIHNMGKKSGSRIRFSKGECCIILHKPHPRNEMRVYQLKQVLELLDKEKMI